MKDAYRILPGVELQNWRRLSKKCLIKHETGHAKGGRHDDDAEGLKVGYASIFGSSLSETHLLPTTTAYLDLFSILLAHLTPQPEHTTDHTDENIGIKAPLVCLVNDNNGVF